MMTDQEYPKEHATTTTTTTTSSVVTEIRFDMSYLRTLPGIIKVVVIILNIVAFICMMASQVPYHSRANFFSFVSMFGFWASGILLVLYLFHVVEKFHLIPWLLIEFIYCAIWAFFCLAASAACAAWGGVFEAWAAAAFFGFAAMIFYAYDAYLKFKGWRAGDLAQGERTYRTTTSTVTY